MAAAAAVAAAVAVARASGGSHGNGSGGSCQGHGGRRAIDKVEEKIGSQQGGVLKINRCSANILLMLLVIVPAACIVISPPRIPANLMMEKKARCLKKPLPAHTLFTPLRRLPIILFNIWVAELFHPYAR